VRNALFIGLCLLVAGCSKSPEPETEQPQVAAPPKPAETSTATSVADSRPVIVAFGDSLSAGFGLDPGFSYPDYLQKILDARGYAYRVVNAGISGDTTSGGAERVRSVIEHRPRIVILELGGNDGLRGLPVSVTRQNLEQMIQQLLQAGAKVVLAGITLPPNYGDGYIRDFTIIYKDLARKYKLPLIPFLLENVALVPGMMQRDGIHPTSEGNRRVAETVFLTLEPLLVKE
jgi:acyl-CoA thioesterase-1